MGKKKTITGIMAVLLATIIIILGMLYLERNKVNKEILLNQTDFTTINIKEALSGTYPKKLKIEHAYYEVENSKGVEQLENIDYKDGKFEINDILLAPEENKITVNLQDNKKNTYEASVNIFFDRGYQYELKNEHVVLFEDNIGYVDNIILVYLDQKATEKDIDTLLEQLKGKIVGRINSVKLLEIEIEAGQKEELEKICKEAEKNDFVETALIDIAYPYENEEELLDDVPNDPWKDVFEGATGVTWDNQNPEGFNWWAEAIELTDAWKYDDKFSDITIGIVDDGFDTKHEDFEIEVLNSDVNSVKNHGTGVAGIIGAKRNNKKGISGVISEAKLIGVDCIRTKEQIDNNIAVSSELDGIVRCIEEGARVVNMSLGLKSPLKTIEAQYESAKGAIEKILQIKQDITEDFIIVQAAGNDGVNAVQHGFFCAITETNLKKYKEEKNRLFNNSEITDQFIIVGGAEKVIDVHTNKYYQLTYIPKNDLFPNDPNNNDNISNYGSQIDIVAPGRDIFTTSATHSPQGKYSKSSGTSQAAPMVSGVSAMVWSVKPELTAGEVKKIICQTGKPWVESNQVATIDDRKYKMLNAKAAVEMVIKQDDTSTEHPKESETTEAKGKRYHLFGHQNFSWEEAKEFCENYSGNLAVVHSQKENDMLMELINMQKENHFISKPCYWLGAEAESTGQWKWVTGENVENYSNWSEGNPDSYDWGEEGRENYLAMIADVEQNDWDSNVSVGQWNDFVNSAEDIGFIGEWENTSFEFTEAQLEIIRTIVSFSREYMLFKSWNEGVDSDTALEKYTINYKEEGLQVYHHCVYNGRFNVQFLPENKYDDSDGGIWVDVKKSDEIISNMFGIFNGMETLFKENEDNVEIKDGKAKIFVGDRGVVSEDIFFDEITQEREDIILNGWHLEYDVNSQVKEGTVENAYRIQVRVRINESGIMENLTFVDLTVEKQ